MTNKKNVLIFIDNRREETNLVSYFKASSCVVKVARNITELRNLVNMNVFDFIIVDSSVSKLGLDAKNTIESLKTPYFYLNEDNNDNFLQNKIRKPYSFSNIITLMQEKIGPIEYDSNKAEILYTDNQYTSVKIDEVINLKVAPFDYFVKINEVKYVKIAKEGSQVTTQILNNIKSKGVYVIYSTKADYSKYLDKMTKSSLSVNKMNIPKEVKLKFLAKTSDLILNQMLEDGITKEAFFNSKQVLDSSMELVMNNDDIYSMLKSLNDLDENAYRHSLAMAVYSVLIAKQMSWETEGTIFKISLGALFADIGLRVLPEEVIKKANIWIDGDDLEKYKQHPLISGSFLKENKDVHQDIIDIVEQHHENCDGTGYPRQLNRNEIHPLAKLVRLAHEFCEIAIKSEYNQAPPHPHEIIERLLATGNKKFEYKYLLALASAFNLKPKDYSSVS